MRRQSPTHRDLLARKGITVPLTNRIAEIPPMLDWGYDYGSVSGDGTLVLNGPPSGQTVTWASSPSLGKRLSYAGNHMGAFILSVLQLNDATVSSELFTANNISPNVSRRDRYC